MDFSKISLKFSFRRPFTRKKRKNNKKTRGKRCRLFRIESLGWRYNNNCNIRTVTVRKIRNLIEINTRRGLAWFERWRSAICLQRTALLPTTMLRMSPAPLVLAQAPLRMAAWSALAHVRTVLQATFCACRSDDALCACALRADDVCSYHACSYHACSFRVCSYHVCSYHAWVGRDDDDVAADGVEDDVGAADAGAALHDAAWHVLAWRAGAWHDVCRSASSQHRA